jgi:Ca-activated chloride channel family protein
MMTASAVPSFPYDPSTGGRLVPVDPEALPLREVSLEASARGGMARVVLRQRFRNAHAEPLTVSYLFPLPEDAAVSGYAFTIGDRRIVGEVDERAAARERFEEAIASGHTAALLDQERTSLFTQEIGNVPPGVEVTAEITLDQPLRWLAERDAGSWEWRFPLASAPRYLGVKGRVADADRVTHLVADAELPVRASLVMKVGDALAPDARLAAPAEVPLDRDVVVTWEVAALMPGASLATFETYGLLTVVPPRIDARPSRVARDLIVLLDTSGSMGGAPLDQARRVCLALIDTLAETDQLEMIEFGSRAVRWKRSAVAATEANKAAARTWLASLRASGSTEMRSAIEEAMSGLRARGQRQVVLVTDGQIGFESEVVAAILQRLPVSSRIHTVGVGSAVNRTLTGGAARAGRGVEVIIALDEDVEKAARRLVARTDAPLVVDVTVSGPALRAHVPARLPDLHAGAPLLVATSLNPAGGALTIRGRTPQGAWTQELHVGPADASGPATGDASIRAFFARQRVEDLEMQISAGGGVEQLELAIEEVGVRFQIATRLTSWVAVDEITAVDPRDPTRRVRVPQNLPYGMSVQGLGLRGAMDALQSMPSFASTSPTSTMAGSMKRSRAPLTGSAPGGFGAPPPPRRASTGALPPAPPAPAPVASRPRAAGIRRALDALGEFFKRERAVRQARGRVVSRAGDALVVELTAEGGALDWILGGATVTVRFSDGTTSAATIAIDRSTREGTLADGTSARAALELASASSAAPVSVTFELVDGTLVVIL